MLVARALLIVAGGLTVLAGLVIAAHGVWHAQLHRARGRTEETP